MKITHILFGLAALWITSANAGNEISGQELLDSFGVDPLTAAERVTPASGVLKVVDAEALPLPEEWKQKARDEARQMEEQGYIKAPSMTAQRQINMYHKRADLDFRKNDLRRTASEIPLAFSSPVGTYIPDDAVLGAAPSGTWVRGGWTGIAIFFFDPDVGSCSITTLDLVANGAAAQVANNALTDFVNDKPAILRVEGTRATGYLYSVIWFPAGRVAMLECATEHFSRDHLGAVVQYAALVDSTD